MRAVLQKAWKSSNIIADNLYQRIPERASKLNLEYVAVLICWWAGPSVTSKRTAACSKRGTLC